MYLRKCFLVIFFLLNLVGRGIYVSIYGGRRMRGGWCCWERGKKLIFSHRELEGTRFSKGHISLLKLLSYGA